MDMDAYQPIKVRHEIKGSVFIFYILFYRTVLVIFSERSEELRHFLVGSKLKTSIVAIQTVAQYECTSYHPIKKAVQMNKLITT